MGDAHGTGSSGRARVSDHYAISPAPQRFLSLLASITVFQTECAAVSREKILSTQLHPQRVFFFPTSG